MVTHDRVNSRFFGGSLILLLLLILNFLTKLNADGDSYWRNVGGSHYDNSLQDNYGLSHLVVIGIKIKGKLQNCAGSIISEDYVLTAASCLYNKEGTIRANPKNIIVTAGFAGLARRMNNIQSSFAFGFKIHKKHDPNLHPSGYDLALIQLDEPFDLDPNMGLDSIRLAEPELAVHAQAVITGWHNNDPGKKGRGQKMIQNYFEHEPSQELKRVAVNLVPNNENCASLFESMDVVDIILTERQRCFVKFKDENDTIQIDLGAPITCLTANEAEPEAVLCGLLDAGSHHGTQEQEKAEQPGLPIISVNVQKRELNRWIVNNAWLPYDEDAFDLSN